MLQIAAIFASFFVLASLSYYVAATICAMRFARRTRQPPPPLPKILPRVAVLKPLRGRPNSLEANLISCLETDYPRCEIYFAVTDYEDPAAAVPVALRARYQFTPMTLIVGGKPGCANRKVGKLIRMAERAARAEILVVSDADVALERDTIRRLVAELSADDKIGLVSCIYRARHQGSWASRLEALFVNSDFAPQVMLSEAIEPVRHALGATIAVKRAALDAIGGFSRIKDLLADDYYIGKLVANAGYKVAVSSAIVTTVGDDRRFTDFWNRQIRWQRTYRTVRPASLATIFIQGPFWASILLIATRGRAFAIATFLVVLLIRIAMSFVITRDVLGLSDQASDAWWVPLKDLLMVVIWFASLFSNQVEWGGRRFRILPNGALSELNV